MKKLKIFIFILLIITLIFILFLGILGGSISILNVEEIKKDRQLKQDLITKLKINNLDSIYEKNTNTYYYMVSEKYEDDLYILNVELPYGFKYKIIDETLNIIRVNYNKAIEVIIYNDKYYYETQIQLTNLPMINIICDNEITTNNTDSLFWYINSDAEEKQININSKIHIRGASSQRFNKKSYKINMYDKNYNKEKEINLSNFYYGNSFILDAVYRDPAKVRNILATELWNEISNNFNNTKINSEFVEFFINNEYRGVCFNRTNK